MKKILLFLALAPLGLGSCEPEIEYEYVEVEQQTYHDPFNDDETNTNQYPHGDNNFLRMYGGWSYSSDSGVLILPIKAELPEGMYPDHVAIKLYLNGNELNPQGYWDFNQDSQDPRVWRRDNQIDLQAGQVISGKLEIRLYVLTENGNPPGYQQIDQMKLPF